MAILITDFPKELLSGGYLDIPFRNKLEQKIKKNNLKLSDAQLHELEHTLEPEMINDAYKFAFQRKTPDNLFKTIGVRMDDAQAIEYTPSRKVLETDYYCLTPSWNGKRIARELMNITHEPSGMAILFRLTLRQALKFFRDIPKDILKQGDKLDIDDVKNSSAFINYVMERRKDDGV